MTLSMHRATVPVFDRMLGNLDFVLDRAAAFCADTGLPEEELMGRRLAPDMFTLAQQVQQACARAGACLALLAGETPPDPDDPETGLARARARIDATRAFVNGFAPERLEGDPDRIITMTTRLGEVRFTAEDFLLHVAHPHFYFHVTTAYDILRAEGVQIGKVDFLGTIMKDQLAAKS